MNKEKELKLKLEFERKIEDMIILFEIKHKVEIDMSFDIFKSLKITEAGV